VETKKESIHKHTYNAEQLAGRKTTTVTTLVRLEAIPERSTRLEH